MLGLVSQVSVAGGRENGLMTENLLDLDQVNASFDQVRGVAVAQAVWRDLFRLEAPTFGLDRRFR